MSEGQHWYSRAGESRYDADLRVARKQSLVPSVTTVMNVVAKPALTNWLVMQGIMSALTGTRRDGEAESFYIERVLAESKQQAIDAANEGTRIHDACEQAIKRLPIPEAYWPHADGMQTELRTLFPSVNDWVSEKSFAHPLGFGGKVDLHSPSTGIVVDFKTKDGDFSDGKKLAWDQNIQLAAYQEGLDLNNAGHRFPITQGIVRLHSIRGKRYTPCANIFVSRTHPGAVASHVWSADDIAHGWSVFEASLELWKRLKKYDASF